MTPKQTALAFIERFCSADPDGLGRLLAPDLVQEESEKVFIKWSWHKSSGCLVLEQSFEISDGRIRAVRLEYCSGC